MQGVRSGRIIPALTDLPVRVLLTTLAGRAGPDAAAIAKDLERLCP